MGYYENKREAFARIKAFLEEREEAVRTGLEPKPFPPFKRRLLLDYGYSEKTLKKMVELLVPEGTIEGEQITKKEVW